MLLFIVLALLVILTKSLITLLATDVGFSFDAAVTIAGLLSYRIGAWKGRGEGRHSR